MLESPNQSSVICIFRLRRRRQKPNSSKDSSSNAKASTLLALPGAALLPAPSPPPLRSAAERRTMDTRLAVPVVGMVMAECAQVGLMIVSKAVMSNGMSNLVFVFYSNAFASLILLPASLIFHRSGRPPLTPSLVLQFFVLGLLGCLAQILGYAGINYSSPTLGSALLNLVPAFTFVLAIICRLERLDWSSSSSLAKCAGTIVCIAGAFVVTLYKGPAIVTTSTSSLSNLHNEVFNLHHKLLTPESNWVLGGLFLVADCVMTSSWLIVQASVLKKYPAELIIVFFYCFFVAIQSAAISFFVERKSSAWSLKDNMRLMAVLYSAVFGSAFQVGVSTWCLHRTGPVFVSMFKPLGIVIAAVAGVLFLGDNFYLGSLVGSVAIAVGFYSVMWGKAKEEKKDLVISVGDVKLNKKKVPLLQTIVEEM
ncbi:hypothetical protein EUGRSUZ_B02544 [Eucalyptus grandis]|uniref:EamA domain-containing protein n=2 Tax=Eucalyptus grandis TaxID=71139 RepID=A0A059D5C3_EUCGR|nr:hypothetical protein EUGRSUZ_B02544 [Eucalyptus grandis]